MSLDSLNAPSATFNAINMDRYHSLQKNDISNIAAISNNSFSATLAKYNNAFVKIDEVKQTAQLEKELDGLDRNGIDVALDTRIEQFVETIIAAMLEGLYHEDNEGSVGTKLYEHERQNNMVAKAGLGRDVVKQIKKEFNYHNDIIS